MDCYLLIIYYYNVHDNSHVHTVYKERLFWKIFGILRKYDILIFYSDNTRIKYIKID